MTGDDYGLRSAFAPAAAGLRRDKGESTQSSALIVARNRSPTRSQYGATRSRPGPKLSLLAMVRPPCQPLCNGFEVVLDKGNGVVSSDAVLGKVHEVVMKIPSRLFRELCREPYRSQLFRPSLPRTPSIPSGCRTATSDNLFQDGTGESFPISPQTQRPSLRSLRSLVVNHSLSTECR